MLGDPARSRVFSPHSPGRWRNRVARLDLDRSQVPAPRARPRTHAPEAAVRAGPRRSIKLSVSPTPTGRASERLGQALPSRHMPAACSRCRPWSALQSSDSIPVSPAYSNDAVARRFLIWERMPAAVRSYGDTVTGAASHLPIADWFQVIVLPVWLVACKCAAYFLPYPSLLYGYAFLACP